MNSLTIDRRTISPVAPTFVIAEIGVNHDGSVSRALELVEHARAAGADAVKLQVFRARQLMHASSAFAGYQVERCAEATPAEMLERYELSAGEVREVVASIRHLTPWSIARQVRDLRQRRARHARQPVEDGTDVPGPPNSDGRKNVDAST